MNKTMAKRIFFIGLVILLGTGDRETSRIGASDFTSPQLRMPAKTAHTPGNSMIGVDVIFPYPKDWLLIRELNLKWIRVTLGWNSLEPEKGKINLQDLENLDNLAHTANSSGVSILLVVQDSPSWIGGGEYRFKGTFCLGGIHVRVSRTIRWRHRVWSAYGYTSTSLS